MKNKSKIRVCNNKKCQKVLPDDYKHKYCEACRNKYAHKTRKIFKGLASITLSVLGVAVASGKINLKK